MAQRRRHHGRALRRRARRDGAVGGLHPLPPLGLRGDAARGVSAAAALPVLPALLEPGRQAGRSRLRALPLRRPLQRRAEAARLRLLRGRSPCATRRCRPRSRRSSPPRSGTSTSPTTTSARPPSSICTIWPATPPTACTSPRWPAPGWSRSPGSAGMRDHGETLAFAPRLPAALDAGCAFRLVYRGRRLRDRDQPGQARYELLAGEPLEVLHHGEPFTLEAGSPQARSCPVAARSRPPSVRRRAGNPAGAVWAPKTAAPGCGSRPPPISRARSYWWRVEGTELIWKPGDEETGNSLTGY